MLLCANNLPVEVIYVAFIEQGLKMMYTDYKNNWMVLITMVASSIVTHLPWYMEKA